MDAEDDRYFGLCKCCLQDGSFRSMWIDFEEGGVVQNFGEMLKESFSLNWQKPHNDLLDQICDDCIQQTKNTYTFRQKVLESQIQLEGAVEVKLETLTDTETCDNEQAVDMVTEDAKVDQDSIDPDYEVDPDDIIDSEYENASNGEEHVTYIQDQNYTDQDDSNIQFEDVQYLEIEIGKEQETIAGQLSVEPEYLFKDHPDQPAEQKRKWPKKKKRGERRSYKNYSLEDLRNSMKAVNEGAMSPAMAAIFYGVPRKTISAKILEEKRGVPPKRKSEHAKRYGTLISEVETLLTYTNATPFKTKTAHYHCAYCSTFGPIFEDADTLRTHTRTQHAGDRTKSVEHFLRPHWLNEVLKVDIENLHCTVCCVVLVTWNDMFLHLKQHHDLDFEEAYSRVIPFTLGRELRCALCKEPFPNYHHLDSHMNAHYNNYMCSECGDTFLSESRLKKHEKIHNIGRFPCEECGKPFTLEKYKRKHVELVHKQVHDVKCLYCSEKFIGTYPRHLHMLERHREKVQFITCEQCGKTFDWRPYYLVHMRRKHDSEKKYKCNYCDAMFFMKSELIRHLVAHTGQKFSCELCDRVYSTKGSLHTHMFNIHGKDMRLRSQP